MTSANNEGAEFTYEFIPEPEEAGERIDKYLAMILPDHSRSFLSGLISDGKVTVGEKTVKSSYRIQGKELIRVSIPEPEPLEILPEDIPLSVVYEDEDLLIVDKPQGMVVHPAPGHTSGTLVNALMYHCAGSLSGINGVMRPGIVHRIDKDTSGLLLVCKNDKAHRAMAEQFAVHSITRIYTAICHGILKENVTVDAPLARDPKDRKRMAIVQGGRRAVTHVEPVEQYKDYTLVRCRLETGRTHQIRVHMASIHHPILGDPVYGPKKCPFTLSGQLLHAGVLGFVHPGTGEYMEFESPLPEYFTRMKTILAAK